MWWIAIVILGVMLYFFTGFTLWGLLCAGWFAFFRWLAEEAEESYNGFVVGFFYILGGLPFIFLTIAYPIPALPILGILLLCVVIAFYSDIHSAISQFYKKVVKNIAQRKLAKEQRVRRKHLLNEFKQVYDLPLPKDWVIKNDVIENIIKRYVCSFSNVDISQKDSWYDLRLKAFYDVSVYAECEPMSIKHPFTGLTNHADCLILRQDINEYIIINNQKTKSEKIIDEYVDLLNDDKITPYQDKLQDINNMQTSFWGLSEKEKTELLYTAFSNAQAELKEMQRIAKSINILLEEARIMAYRNIYLGVELINYCRENSGGKTLTTEKSIAEIANIKFHDLNINSIDLQFNTIASFATGTLTSLETISSNKNLTKFAVENPKTAGIALLIALLIGGALSVIEARNEAIKNNIRMQAEIIKQFPKIVDQYEKNKALMMRSIEITKSIIKANNGFISIYAPLRNKAFIRGEELLMNEVQTLAIATTEYKNISMSKIK